MDDYYGYEEHGITRRRVVKGVRARGKRFNVMKLLRSSVFPFTQQLTLCDEVNGNKIQDCLVSEYNPGTGGYVPIFNEYAGGSGWTPMHVYDLNFVQLEAAKPDTITNFPTAATGVNSDINKRAWVWRGSTFNALNGILEGGVNSVAPRYRVLSTDFALDSNKTRYIYRKGICIDFMMYGCQKMETEYDIRVIKILDPTMCPDYDQTLAQTVNDAQDTFRLRWNNLVRSYTINPMLKGTSTMNPVPERGRWFKTVAKRKIKVNEQSADTDQVQCVQGRIYVPVNEVADLNWSMGNNVVFTSSDVRNMDTVPNSDVTALQQNYQNRPHYRSRYYLVIRALSPYSVGVTTGEAVGEESIDRATDKIFLTNGRSAVKYTPTYDLNVRTTFMRVAVP